MDEWAYGGKTDMLALTFGCARHHELLGPSTITGGPYAALTATPEGVVRHRTTSAPPGLTRRDRWGQEAYIKLPV
ncbi:hypothetical protein CCUG62472_03767 [Mycobacteroides salmoniphilum]|nr:hypothetical protein CCUG62472_03767 [Mycobacteroides salmoniphilum]